MGKTYTAPLIKDKENRQGIREAAARGAKIEIRIADIRIRENDVCENVVYGWGNRFICHWLESLERMRELAKHNVDFKLSNAIERESFLFFDPEQKNGRLYRFRSLPGTEPKQRAVVRIDRSRHEELFKKLWENCNCQHVEALPSPTDAAIRDLRKRCLPQNASRSACG